MTEQDIGKRRMGFRKFHPPSFRMRRYGMRRRTNEFCMEKDTMEFQDFTNKIKDIIGAWLGNGYEITLDSVRKNNDICLSSLSINRPDSNISPVIYLEPFYHEMIKQGKKLVDVAKEILHVYKEHEVDEKFDLEQIMDYENVKTRLKFGLINTKMNKHFLSEVPHREFLDLSIIYRIVLNCRNEGEGSITVKHGQMAAWGVTEQTLFEQACTNRKDADEIIVTDMRELLREFWEEDPIDDMDGSMGNRMYVAGTKNRMHGAVAMLDREVMHKAEEMVGKDFMILPSSVHELILIPSVDGEDEEKQLSEMVKTVNRTLVLEHEILSDHVYRYHSETGNITIAA